MWAPLSSHLGFPTPHAPLFDALLQSTDPVDHIRFAKELGLAGIADPFAAMRSVADQKRIGRAAAAHGLPVGTFLYAPFDAADRMRWGSTDPDARAIVLNDVRAAVAIADRLGAKGAAILSLGEADVPPDVQIAAMIDLLRFAGDIAGEAEIELRVEGVNPSRLPQMLLHGVEASAAVVRAVAHPNVRLLFDTGHAAAVGEDVVTMLERHHDLIGATQIADFPGRVEMGGGEIDFARFFATATAVGLAGPYELEHRWSRPGPDIQRQALERWMS